MQKSQGFTPDIQSFILAHEGGYVDHPKDPGGATNLGITIKTLAAWRKREVSKAEVRALTKSDVIPIYKANYWDVMRCSLLPLGLDYMVMDYGVNSGPARSVKDLQRTVGADDDGALGAKTIAKIEEYIQRHGMQALLKAFADRRWNFMQGLSTFGTFGDGWKKRVWGKQMGVQTNDIGTVDRAWKLAQGVPAAAIPLPEATIGLAMPEKPSVIELAKDPTTLTGIAGAVATIFGAIQDQPVLQIAAVAAIGVVVFLYLKKRREENPT